MENPFLQYLDNDEEDFIEITVPDPEVEGVSSDSSNPFEDFVGSDDQEYLEFPSVDQTERALVSAENGRQANPLDFADEPGLTQAQIDESNRLSASNTNAAAIDELKAQASLEDMLWVPEAIAGGTLNAARDASMLGGALMEGAGDLVGSDRLSGLTKRLDKTIPKYEAKDDARRSVLAGVTSAGVGIGFGAVKTAQALAKIAPNLGKIKKAVGVLLGSEIGGTITGGSEDTLLPWQIMGQDEKGEFHENLLRQRVDFLADSVQIGGGVGTALGLGGKALKYGKDNILKSMLEWRNLEAREKDFVEVLMDMASGIDLQTASREQIQAARERVLSYVAENREVATNLQDRLVNDRTFKRDTVSTLSDLPGMSDVTQGELGGLRSSALSGSSPRLEKSLDAPARELDSLTDELISSRGGREGVQQAGDDIISSGVADVSRADDIVRGGQSALVRAERGIEESIRNDPTFAPILKDLGDRVNIDMSDAHRVPADKMAERLIEASRKMTDEKNRLYSAIPAGSQVDTMSLEQASKPAIDSGALSGDLLEKFKAAGDDFKELDRFSNFELGPAIKNLYDTNQIDRARQLQDLRRNITDEQLDFIADNGDDIAKKAATAARDFYKKDFAPFWRENPVLEEIRDISYTPGRTFQVPQARSALERQLVNTDIPEYTDSVIDVLSRKEAGESQGLAMDYTLGKIADEVSTIINRDGRLTPENSKHLTEYIGKFSPILDKLDPARKVQIEDFFTNLRDQNFDVNTMRENLKTFQKNADDVRQRVFDDELREFFDKGKGVPNAQAALSKLFNSPQSTGLTEGGAGRLDSILKRVEGNPIARDGIEAAWITEAKKKFFAGKDGAVEMLNDDHFLAAGKKIFGEDEMNSVVMGLQEVADMAKAGQRANITRGSGGLSFGAGQEKMRTAVNMVTTFIFGVLNPTAARVRTVSGDLLKTYSETDLAKRAGDIILADVDAFYKIAKDITEKGTVVMTDREKRILRQSFYKAGYYLDDDDPMNPESGLDEQTDDALAR